MSDAILQLAKQHLQKVKKSGNENIMAVCPFHRKADGSEERSPSFSMNINSGLWYCHSCHARGGLYSFLTEVGLSRSEIDFRHGHVLKEAEEHAPARPDPLRPIEPCKEPLEERFLGNFDYCPQLLLDEGYPEELLRRFDVGFDEKHSRITFPLRDANGVLVGISGRTITNAQPRYKVYTDEYLEFGLEVRKLEKRAILWNVHSVRTILAFEKDPGLRFVVVTEGFKAVMRVAQAGISTVVGLLGAHMSQEQLWTLTALDVPILLMLDYGEAGRLGQIDAAQRLVKTVPSLYVLNYDAPQPSELTTSAIIDAVLQAQPAVVWLHQQAFQATNTSYT